MARGIPIWKSSIYKIVGICLPVRTFEKCVVDWIAKTPEHADLMFENDFDCFSLEYSSFGLTEFYSLLPRAIFSESELTALQYLFSESELSICKSFSISRFNSPENVALK